MGKWSLTKMELPLKVVWKISRNSSSSKINFLIKYTEDDITGMGETAFNVRYGESANEIQNQFRNFCGKGECQSFTDNDDFQCALKSFTLARSLRFGLETAWLDWKRQKERTSWGQVLGVRERASAPTSFSIPIMDPSDVGDYIKRFNLNRFESLKLKVSGLESKPLLDEVLSLYGGKLRVDGNEGFERTEDIKTFFNDVDPERIEFLEQPLPSLGISEQKKLKKCFPFPIIADESLTDDIVTPELADLFDGINIKLMKSGSHLMALDQKKRAMELGLKVMFGCMIETSLGIGQALTLGEGVDYFDLDGFLILEKDPFQLLVEENGILKRKV